VRLDLFLKYSRLVPRRPVAQEICDAGAVRLNNAVAKPGRSVSVGDTLAIRYRGWETRVRVAKVPERPPSKAEAATLYELLGSERYE